MKTQQVVRLLNAIGEAQEMLAVFEDEESRKFLKEGRDMLLSIRGAIDSEFRVPPECDRE